MGVVDVVPLRVAASLLGRSLCGGKAYELARLLADGYPVPDGVVITSAAYRRVRESSPLESECAGFRLTASRIPADLLTALLDAFYKLRSVYGAVSVRSSSSSEDLTNASFAGQYETVLNVQTSEELIAALERCWASVGHLCVQTYAQVVGVEVQEAHMAVLMQGMVPAEQSGVAFSVHPVTLSDTILINASYGLGEAVVSGLVTPDTFEYDKVNGRLTSQIGEKDIEIVRAQQGVMAVPVDRSRQDKLCLRDHEVLALCQMVQRLEDKYGVGVDVEFAFANGYLHLLQVRPITTSDEGTVRHALSL